MDYSELGAYLKEEREKKGFSLEDIQQKTKISMSSLEAIEAGRVNELPHPVYTKGFIKNYAQCLGLNAEDVAGTFAQKAGIDEEFEDEVDHVHNELTPIRGRSKWPLISILISLILLAILGWLVYDLFLASPETNINAHSTERSESRGDLEDEGHRMEGEERGEAAFANNTGMNDSDQAIGAEEQEMHPEMESKDSWTSGPVAGNDTLAGTQAFELLAEAEPNDTDQAEAREEQKDEAEAAGEDQEQSDTGEDQEQSDTGEDQEQSDTGTRAEQAGTQSVPPPEDDEHVLQIEATEACWMSANIDSKKRDMYLRPGETATFRFDDSLEVKLGNAGGVELTYNGQPYPLEAESGDVESLSFP